jgi:hypothetical protein
MAERHWMMIQRNRDTGRPRTAHTDDYCVIVEGFVRVSLRTEKHCRKQLCGTSHALERNIPLWNV